MTKMICGDDERVGGTTLARPIDWARETPPIGTIRASMP